MEKREKEKLLKKKKKLKKLIVAGCLAQRYAAELMEELPEVDAIIGTGDIDKIENIDKSSIPYSWFQSHGILIQEGLYPRLAYLKVLDELYFKEDK